MLFDFPYHKVSTSYPDDGYKAKLGNSYNYTAPPPAPSQRVFKLKFKVLKYFTNADGTINTTTQAQLNLGALEVFYQAHKQHASFSYLHPVYGEVTVKFSKPLEIPEGADGGMGVYENIEVEFTEQPGLQDSATSDLLQIQYEDLT